ncbi:MAG: hypothetical protein WCA53_02045 [Caballeronia sp.]
MKNTFSSRLLAGIAGMAIVSVASLAHAADVRLGINIGIPAPVYVVPQPYYAPPPPPVVYAPAPVYVRPPQIVIGWYGNRYYDGRRYWARDDWYRHHGGPGYGHGHGGYGGPGDGYRGQGPNRGYGG